MDVKYDAIIIGLGPVGSFMALKLEIVEKVDMER